MIFTCCRHFDPLPVRKKLAFLDRTCFEHGSLFERYTVSSAGGFVTMNAKQLSDMYSNCVFGWLVDCVPVNVSV